MLGKIVNVIMVVCGLVGAGYMFFTGESVGWIVAGFIGGLLAPIVIVGAIFGFFQGLFSKPKYNCDPNRQRELERSAYLTGKPY